jgi:DNA gyrase subunit A
MTDRTGLGIVDLAVLETLDRIGARSDRPHKKCARAVAEVDATSGLGPNLAYEALCDMARPWVVPVRCIQFHGNYGSLDSPSAGPRYTEARLSPIGMLAVVAERREIGAIPIGLINGNTHSGGTRPPFHPRKIVTALRHLLVDPAVADQELTDLVGPPVFPTGCEVAGDIAALTAGESVTLQLSAHLRLADPPTRRWIIDHLPPLVGGRELLERIANLAMRRPWSADLPELDRRTRVPVSTIDAMSTGPDTQLVIKAATGVDLDALGRQLREVQGVTIKLPVQLPGPLPRILRNWVATHATDDLRTSLARVEELLD